MYIAPISYSYWRMIKQGFRTFTSVMGDDKKEQVKYLAQEDVKVGVITEEKYFELIGEAYPAGTTS